MPGLKDWLSGQEAGFLQAKEMRSAQRALAGLRGEYASGAITADKYNQQMSRFTDQIGRAKAGTQGLSRTVHASNLSFQSVGEAIANAVLKVSLWIAATTVVIGSVRKMQEVLQLWKDLEVTLERIGITTSTFGAQLFKFFGLTADVAIRMGMPIEQTLTGMDLALRATASYGDQVQRTATATLMLRDAAILGNVAGMQFSQAIDILVGSLRQTGMNLDQGIVLLDKWVAVAKSAAVSVNDLAQGFAIMSSAAASAGLNVDQVNGIITALSESVTLGPVEVGNAIRALMATLYNPGSITTMGKFGVAVRDATGEFRSFWEIMTELSAMTVTGALDEKQILQIAKAAGAGQRRYAQFVALLKNWGNAVRAATISAEAYGDALDANERIINTLTNAFDQFTAAQNKFWYSLGDKSGAIEDLTGTFQLFANVFSIFSNLNEPLALVIKLVSQLAVSFLVLKLAALAITKLHLIGWLTTLVKPLGGLRNATALAGFGAGAGRFMKPAGLEKATVAPWGQLKAPTGGYTAPGGQVYKGGRFLPMMATPLGRGDVARTAWSGLGTQMSRVLLSPMRGLGLVFGMAAGGMLMKELYDSNWAGIGGGIGAGVGGFLLGPAGLAIGAIVGGGIARVIEQATMSFEDRVAKEREKWMKELPDEIADSLSKVKQKLDLTDTIIIPLDKFIEKTEIAYDELITKEKDLLERRESQIQGYEDIMEGKYGRGPGVGEAMQGAAIARWWASMFTEPKMELQREEKIPSLIEAQRLAAEPEEALLTVFDEIAILAEEISKELAWQGDIAERLNDIKAKSLKLTQEEIEELMSLSRSAPITYYKLLAGLTRYEGKPEGLKLPEGIAEKFKEMYPTYEDFVTLSPEAYRPLVEALGTLASKEELIREATENRAAAVALLKEEAGGTEDSIANITKQWKYWSDIQAAAAAGTTLEPFYKGWGITPSKTAAGEALNYLNSIVETFLKGKDGAQDMIQFWNDYNTALAVSEGRLKHIGEYVEPGRLSFFAPEAGMGKIQGMLDRYEGMFGKYLGSQEEIYHAFVKGEEGVVQGFYETFEARPEVWQAMLAELKGIEKNTKEALDVEYNIPGWYQTPGKFWAANQIAATYGGFEPSNVLRELWAEFVGNRSMQGGGIVPATGPYYLHKNETVLSDSTLRATNSILSNSYRSSLMAQGYLAQINLGIQSLHRSIRALGQAIWSPPGQDKNKNTPATQNTVASQVLKSNTVPTYAAK